MLKGTHLPITIKDIQVGCLNSPYFKGLYLFLTQNRLPSSKNTACTAIETSHSSRKRNCIISYTRNVCRQDNNTLLFMSFCGTPRCNNDIPNISQQVLYARPYALFVFLHKELSLMSTV